MRFLVIDFETRSEINLLTAGADIYARDSSTEILCCCFKDTSTGREWVWQPGDSIHPDLLIRIRDVMDGGDLFAAHNAVFDYSIWNCGAVDFGWPPIPLNYWYCTMAAARVNALPQSLDNATRAALDSKHRKDHRGTALIKKMSIPPFEDTPELRREMVEYCAKDVEITCELLRVMRSMTGEEHADWLLCERMNDRGVRVDVELATLAQNYAEFETREISELLSELTEGQVTKHTQGARIKTWLRSRLAPKHPIWDMMTVHKKGEKKLSLDKSIRENILLSADDGTLHLNAVTYDVIALTSDGNRSSTAKFGAMLTRADPDDDRVRGAFVYYGAGQTGRFASRGLQLHNLRRDCYNPEDADGVVECMRDNTLDMVPGNIMDIMSKMLRPAIIPDDGNVFVIGDWSAIEARVLPWLANAQEPLDVFKRGEDPYLATADEMRMTGVNRRQIGKVAVLSLGFGGGKGAFQSMARNYSVSMGDDAAQAVVERWRNVNPWAEQFWHALERAAMKAMTNPGTTCRARKVSYVFVPRLLGGTLMCYLPGGTVLQYPYARVEEVETPWGAMRSCITAMKGSFTASADAEEWPRAQLWYGVLAENATQATAATLLRSALMRLITQDVVAHMHDEIVLEVSEAGAEDTRVLLKHIMTTPPEWALDLPLDAEPVIVHRYGK